MIFWMLLGFLGVNRNVSRKTVSCSETPARKSLELRHSMISKGGLNIDINTNIETKKSNKAALPRNASKKNTIAPIETIKYFSGGGPCHRD